MTKTVTQPPAANAEVIGLRYRPNEFDDWGQIRNADGSMFASVRRPASEDELAEHRRAGTDPYEDLARRLIASFEPSAPALNVADLEEQVAFTMSDASRLLRKQDVQGACPHPNDCFYETDRVRCGPCAVKESAAKGIEIDDTHSHLPEVCRLRREARAQLARIAELEAATPPATNVKRRRQPLYLKGFRQARDLAIEVIETVNTTDRSLLANALRAIHPPTKARQKSEGKPNA